MPSAAGSVTSPPYRERRFPPTLIGFTVLSVFAHAAAFFLFQVVYPQRVTLPPPAPRVALLTPDTPEQQALLHWVAAEDPALVAASAGTEPAALLLFPYHPSYEALRTPPRLPPEEPVRPEPPPSPISLAPGIAAAPAETAPPPVRALTATTVQLSGGLTGRTVSSGGAPVLHASAPLQPVQFLLALSDRGEPRFTFLQRSSGDDGADAAAAAWLARTSFSRAESPLAWGIATVVWGDDVYALPSAPAGPAK